MQSSKRFNWPLLVVHMVLGPAIVAAMVLLSVWTIEQVDLMNPNLSTEVPFGVALLVSALAAVAMILPALLTGVWLGFRSTSEPMYSRSEALIVGSVCSAAVLISVSRAPFDELQLFLILLGGVDALCCRWLLLWGDYLHDPRR